MGIYIGYFAVAAAVVLLAILTGGLFYNGRLKAATCWRLGLGLTVCFTIISFMTYPNSGTDLLRYYNMLLEMGNYSTKMLFTNWWYSSTPLTVLLFMLVKKINVLNLLPAIATAVIMILYTGVIARQARRGLVTTTSGSMYTLTVLAISGVRAILTGVRQHLAVAIVLLAVERLFWNKKRDGVTLMLIVLPILIHTGTAPFVAFLMAFYFFPQLRLSITVGVSAAMFLLLNVRINLPVIQYIQSKFWQYQQIEYTDKRFFAVRIIFYFLLMTVWWLNRKRLERSGLGEYSMFFLSVAIFGVSTFTNNHLFDRTFNGLVIFSLPLMHCMVDRVTERTRIRDLILILCFVFLMVGIFAYQLVDLKTSWRLWDTILRG